MKTNEIPTTVDGLALKWANLNNFQRAEALLKLRGKTSFRALAKKLGCSASLLRNLVLAGQAPLADRMLARQGKISTRELVRRSKAAAKAHAVAQNETLDRARTMKAKKWCEVICDWIETEGFTCAHGEHIVNEARRELSDAEQAGKVPQVKPPKEMPVEEIISRCRPPQPKFDEIIDIAWYAIWLARWAYFTVPDTVVRDRALGLALNRQIAREPANPVRAEKRIYPGQVDGLAS